MSSTLNELKRRDLETRGALKRSEKTMGQLYPVLKNADGNVIDGYHRLDANPRWKSVTLDHVKSEEDRLIVAAHVNLGRRTVSAGEKADIINDLAEIYYQQGLRPDVLKEVATKNGGIKRVHYNEIKHKIAEVLKGVVSPSHVGLYLRPKYVNQTASEARKKYSSIRRANASPYILLKKSHGNTLRKRYGETFFYRLEGEFFDKAVIPAKETLRYNKGFRNEIEVEIRKKYNENIINILKKYEDMLRTDRDFIETVKAEIREEYEAEPNRLVVAK